LTREAVLKIGDRIRYVSPFRAGAFPVVIVGVNADGTFDIDVTITGMGDVDGRAKHSTTRYVDDRPVRLCGISPARLISAGQTQAAE
jgi:hypothetical protein